MQSCLFISLYIEVSAYYAHSLVYLSVCTLRYLLIMYTVFSAYQMYIDSSAYDVYSLVYVSVCTWRYHLIMYTLLSMCQFVH